LTWLLSTSTRLASTALSWLSLSLK